MNSTGKKLRDYMKLPYTVMLRRDEEGDFIARIKELEGCVADGQDEIEALGNLEKIKELWIETALKANKAIPIPEEDEGLPSGKFLTRLPRSLHKSLIEIAESENVSLNQLVTVILSEAAGRKSAVPLKTIEINASTYNQPSSGAYGPTYGTPKLLLVSAQPNRNTSDLFEQHVLTDLSNRLSPLTVHKTRKEA
jgi:predicted RNase H-like HicB family nuclease